MSSFPPPPPSQPPYDPNAWRAQRQAARAQQQAMKMQMRMQRAQMKAQMRANRRGSIAGPVLLIALGIVFLLAQTGKMSWWMVATWYGTWWPVVLIGAGLILLAEWAYDHHLNPDPATRGRRTLGGGVVFLLVVMAFIGIGTWGGTKIYEHHLGENSFFGKDLDGWNHFGDEHDEDASLNYAMPTAESLTVRNPHGDVTVTGASTDGQVHVSAHKQVWSWKESEAEDKQRRLEPQFTDNGSSLVLSIDGVEGGQADLTVQIPAGTMLNIEAGHGDISVTGMQAGVKLTQNHGDVELEDITGSVDAHIQDDNSSVQAHTIHGALLIEGRSGDVNLSDVTGDVNLQGDFFGTTHLERVNGLVRFDSSRTQFSATRLDGELEIERGELQGDQLLGPVTLTSNNKDISLERVAGSVKISNRGKGDITISNAPPLGPITIDNEHGSVNVGVPENTGFVLSAQAKRGDLENDFDVPVEGSDSLHTAMQTVGHGGPGVTITTEGDVVVRKSAQMPLPPAPPAPPAPTAPKVVAPKAPKTPAAPKPVPNPKPAPAPKPPVSQNF